MSNKFSNGKKDGISYSQLSNLNVYERLAVCGKIMPVGPTDGASKTVDKDYTVTDGDSVLRVTGARTVTLPDSLGFPVTIYAADSTVTLSVTPENQASNTITVGKAWTLYYDATLDGYFTA